jgi:hypothetical protein
MKFIRKGSYATVVSTAALVVALGGTSYAASLITSSDIKDGTIQTKDLNPDARITAKTVRNDHVTALGSTKTVLSMNLSKGTYVLNSKAVAMYTAGSAFANCALSDPNSTTLDYSYWYAGPSGTGYGTLADQAVVTVGATGTYQLNCSGSNANLIEKKLTAVKVASASSKTGPDVSRSAAARTLGPVR